MSFHKTSLARLVALLLVLAALGGFAALRRQQAIAAIPFPMDFLAPGQAKETTLCGFGDLEEHDGSPYRWGMGPGSQLSFVSPFPAKATLVVRPYNPLIPGQQVRVYVNGKMALLIDMPNKQTGRDEAGQALVVFEAKPGYNTVYFEYKDWNHGSAAPVEGDSRRFALEFLELKIL